eukprot:SAG31_NODE_53_length_30139_cov_31.002197_2_plen_493_part_00
MKSAMAHPMHATRVRAIRLLRSQLLIASDDLIQDTEGSSILQIYKDKGKALLEALAEADAVIKTELAILTRAVWDSDGGTAELQFLNFLHPPRILGDKDNLTLRLVLKPQKQTADSQKQRTSTREIPSFYVNSFTDTLRDWANQLQTMYAHANNTVSDNQLVRDLAGCLNNLKKEFGSIPQKRQVQSLEYVETVWESFLQRENVLLPFDRTVPEKMDLFKEYIRVKPATKILHAVITHMGHVLKGDSTATKQYMVTAPIYQLIQSVPSCEAEWNADGTSAAGAEGRSEVDLTTAESSDGETATRPLNSGVDNSPSPAQKKQRAGPSPPKHGDTGSESDGRPTLEIRSNPFASLHIDTDDSEDESSDDEDDAMSDEEDDPNQLDENTEESYSGWQHPHSDWQQHASEKIYACLHDHVPDALKDKMTGLILQLHPTTVENLIENPTALRTKIEELRAVIRSPDKTQFRTTTGNEDTPILPELMERLAAFTMLIW